MAKAVVLGYGSALDGDNPDLGPTVKSKALKPREDARRGDA
jgi:hypothetical protein